METQTAPNDLERSLVQRFAELSNQKKALEISIEEISKKRDEVEAELMQLLDDQGKKSSANYEGLGKVTSVEPTPYASIVAGEEETLFSSLRELGRDDLIKLTVNTTSLSAVVRECLKNGSPTPAGCNVYYKRRLKFTPLN